MGFKCEVYPVEGVQNLRDLGGYPAGERATVKRRFIRSASLSALTEKGIGSIKDLGVDCVVDLRSAYELRQNKNTFAECSGINYINMPMLDNLFSTEATGSDYKFPSSMAEMYTGLLAESNNAISRVFDIFAGPYKTVLFHCTAGKDRTGIMSMLLLGLAGVDEESIIDDYSYTDTLMTYNSRAAELPDFLFRAMPETMRETLSFLSAEYGGINSYLTTIGISSQCLEAVKSKLLTV